MNGLNQFDYKTWERNMVVQNALHHNKSENLNQHFTKQWMQNLDKINQINQDNLMNECEMRKTSQQMLEMNQWTAQDRKRLLQHHKEEIIKMKTKQSQEA